MSQRYQQDFHGVPMNGLERSLLRLEAIQLHPEEQLVESSQVYDSHWMLREEIDMSRLRKATADMFDHQMQSNFRWSHKQQAPLIANQNGPPFMHLHGKTSSSSSYLHQDSWSSHHPQGFNFVTSALTNNLETPGQFTLMRNGDMIDDDENKVGTIFEGQGLSLSLSSSLHNFEASKFQPYRNQDGGVFLYDQRLYFDNGKNIVFDKNIADRMDQVHVGYSANSSRRTSNVLKSCMYFKATRELLDEFCCISRGKASTNPRVNRYNGSPKSDSNANGVGRPDLFAAGKEQRPLSAGDRSEYQRKKAKLLSLLDEVNARYKLYRDQMQTIVNSFDSMVGYGAAAAYTDLAQKAMSRHFRNTKDAILSQLKITCEVLGDKLDAFGTMGLTKGETPRLKVVDQKIRQQKAFHQMGILDPDSWRPQRGLPERSVNTLRAWLFEHFLHPYPSDADKHMLSRQTGLSKNQVSNWFINARVRLWKPMVEEIYNQEITKEDQQETTSEDPKSLEDHHTIVSAGTPKHSNKNNTNNNNIKTNVTLLQADENDPSKETINACPQDNIL